MLYKLQILTQCPDAWEGDRCDVDVNECARFAGTDLGCQGSYDVLRDKVNCIA